MLIRHHQRQLDEVHIHRGGYNELIEVARQLNDLV